MNKSSKISILVVTILLILLQNVSSAEVKNVIVLICDGMGFEQVRAASMYGYGQEGQLCFEQYYRGEMTTHSANSHLDRLHVTCSAAAASALATGQKVNNRVVNYDVNDEPIKPMMKYQQEFGRATGIVTTSFVTDVTIAGFCAHCENRDASDASEIVAEEYLTQSRLNLLFGAYQADGSGMTPRKARLGGYQVARTRQSMLDMTKSIGNESVEGLRLMGLFAAAEEMPYEFDYNRQKGVLQSFEGMDLLLNYDLIPHLSEMAATAINILEDDPDGFFLMIEGVVDHAGHDNIIEHSVGEMLEFEATCQVVFDWVKDRDDTLVLIISDHETGGLRVIRNKGRGFMPEIFWGSTQHTGINVPVYATGQGAEEFEGVIDNTDIFKIIMKLTER